MSTSFWADARAQMLLDPAVINLNTGSFGPTPRAVFDRVTELRQRLAAEPMNFLIRQAPPLLWQARERLAAYLGGDPRRLVFTANVSAAINIVASGLRLASPGEILTTDHEYGAMVWCWERAAQRQGLSIRTLRLPALAEDPAEIVDAFRRAISEKTRLLFFSHVLSPTGLILPAKGICAEARRRGVITVVDGAHAPAVVDLNLNSLGCDFYGGNCHKWLLAPIGTGFLYLPPAAEDRLEPLQVSWGYRYDWKKRNEPDEFGTTPFVRSLEFEGTRDPSAWISIPAANDFQDRLGPQRIRERISELTGYVRRKLRGRFGLRPGMPDNAAMRGPMTTFRLPEGYSDFLGLREALWKQARIEMPFIERPDGLLIRVSTHFYNTEEEIDRLADALPAVLQRS